MFRSKITKSSFWYQGLHYSRLMAFLPCAGKFKSILPVVIFISGFIYQNSLCFLFNKTWFMQINMACGFIDSAHTFVG